MPQIHLHAEPGDYAPLVLLPGDPNRATRIAARFDGGLERARRVNDNRALYGYTGTWKGHPVSVQTTGMGTPSLSIVVEELLRLGATRLVRIGTCGGIGRGIATGDMVVATAAVPADGSTRTYLNGEPYAPAADFGLTRALVDAARERAIEPHVGLVATIDVFSLYNPDQSYTARWRERGVLAFEMEAAALFYLASRATASGGDVRAACVLTVVDTTPEEGTSEAIHVTPAALEAATERMIEVALDAGASL
jgi:DeoD family purine-nucleoside phosphorylase